MTAPPARQPQLLPRPARRVQLPMSDQQPTECQARLDANLFFIREIRPLFSFRVIIRAAIYGPLMSVDIYRHRRRMLLS
jgi:hypothetical protein